MVVANNLLAMNAQRQFKNVNNAKRKSSERLSSGYRINRSADDAAGLAISEKMRRQIRGLNKGASNSQDGISLLQVADGALAEVHDMLHRITELSVQAANDTNTEQDRQAIQKEISQIISEIDKVGNNTEFNTKKLFCGPDTAVVDGSAPTTPTPSTPVLPTDHVTPIQSSFSVVGTPSGIAAGTKTISANTSSISIAGTNLSWSDFKQGGINLDLDNIVAGNYSTDFKGMKISFTVGADANKDDIVNALNNASFDIKSTTQTTTPISFSNVKVNAGTQTDSVLSGAWHSAERETYFFADDSGVRLENNRGTTYSSFTWSELGISDINNAGGQTATLNDSVTGISFSANIKSGATKQDVISAFTTKFTWDYVDCKETENALKGITVLSGSGITNRGVDGVSVSQIKFSHNVSVGDLYTELGYTTPSSRINGVTADIKITKNDQGTYCATYEAANGHTHSEIYNSPGSLSNNAKMGGLSNSISELNLVLKNTGTNADKQKEALETHLGETIATVSLPSPYKFSMTEKTVTSTTYLVGNVKTKPYSPSGEVAPTDPDSPSTGDSVDTEPLKLWIQSGSEEMSGMYIEIDKMNADILGISGIDVSTHKNASESLTKVQKAVAMVSDNRSKIGAQQNRLEHAKKIADNISENTEAAESRIRDTDMAKEMVEQSKQNILEQVGTTMMAQANQSTQGVLSLLQG